MRAASAAAEDRESSPMPSAEAIEMIAIDTSTSMSV
jgi:hypothetical protein